MDLVYSLLQAIVSVDGEALVMRTGEKPYLIGLAGQIDLASGALSLDAVNQVMTALLPAPFQATLAESGVVQYNLPPQSEFPLEHFTAIAARGGDDVWIEVRRRRATVDEQTEHFHPPPVAVPSNLRDADDDADSRRPAPTVVIETSPVPEPRPAAVVPLVRTPIHASPVAVAAAAEETRPELEHVFRLAAARGASTVYLACGAPPTLRVDGELQVLHDEAALTSNEIGSWLLSLMASRTHESLGGSASAEWVGEIEQLGRVRCMTFSDHRGPGAVLRLVSRVMTAEELGLSHQIVALVEEREGLVLVSGPRSSGKRTLIAALIDTINRTRRDHVITIEREITVAHVSASAFVSQREVRGTDGDMLAAATSALREDPDVLVLEGIDTAAMLDFAVETAARGHLVMATCVAHSTTQALDRALGLYPPEKVERAQQALADCLRGVVSQVLPLKSGGGRIAARELLIGTPAVRKLIAEGRTSQLDGAMEAGRRHGMASLVDVLAAYVQNGLVDMREAFRHVADRDAFRALLDRRGIDISPIERLA